MAEAHPQISSYMPLDIETTYVIVFLDYMWEVCVLVNEWTDDLGTVWYEVQSMEDFSYDDENSSYDVLPQVCKKLPYCMTVWEYMDKFIKGNLP